MRILEEILELAHQANQVTKDQREDLEVQMRKMSKSLITEKSLEGAP